MAGLPKVICASVVRSAHQGQSHGGVYIVDLETDEIRQVVDWNDGAISFEGRGLDRGLRGIAFWGGDVWIAASDELIRYDPAFRIRAGYRNPYLRHCHEIAVSGDDLFLTSTGFDSVLTFDLRRERFTAGLLVRARAAGDASMRLDFRRYDPERAGGPAAGDTVHINNVVPADEGFFFSALRLPVLLDARAGGVRPNRPLPTGSHNARPLNDGALLNDTAASRLARTDAGGRVTLGLEVPEFDQAVLLNTDLGPDHARPRFNRGLALLDDEPDLVAVGASPASVSVFSLRRGERLKTVTLTHDVRNAIHGLEVWPWD